MNDAYQDYALHARMAIAKFEREVPPVNPANTFWPVETWEQRQRRFKKNRKNITKP